MTAGGISNDGAMCGKWTRSLYKCWMLLSLVEGAIGLSRHVYGVSLSDNPAVLQRLREKDIALQTWNYGKCLRG